MKYTVTFFKSIKFIPMIAFWHEINTHKFGKDEDEFEDIHITFWILCFQISWWIQLQRIQ